MEISFIIPTRNNIEYLKLAIMSIRKLKESHEIIVLDDNSTDNTAEYIDNLISSGDNNLKLYVNKNDQVGHTILYNLGVMLSSNDVFSIFHADMICSPNYVVNLTKHLLPQSVVCATRIEPPLHPPASDKIINNFGMYPFDFNYDEFIKYVEHAEHNNKDLTQKSIFAPWIMYKKDFIDMGGHDELFKPFPYEDSDIFNRFVLNKFDIIQSKDSFVYHFTCRGHRWTDQIKVDSNDFKIFEEQARRNFIRKWGTFVKTTKDNYPIILPKYNISYHIKNCDAEMLYLIEPYGYKIYVDNNNLISDYIEKHQSETIFSLKDKLYNISDIDYMDDIIIDFDANIIKNDIYNIKHFMYLIDNMSEIINQSDVSPTGETYVIDIFSVKINKLQQHENNFINNVNNKILQYLLAEL